MTLSKIQEKWLRLAEKAPQAGSSIAKAAQVRAKELLKQTQLPHSGSEHYKRFDIDAFLDHPWEVEALATDRPHVAPSEYRCHTMTDDAIQCRFIGGKYYLLEEHPSEAPYFIGSLTRFEQLYPQVAERYFYTMPSLQRDPLAALNILFGEEALVIYLPKGVKVEQPIHLVEYTALKEGKEEISFPHTVVIAEAESEVRLLTCDHALQEGRAAKLGLLEIYAEEHSAVEYYDVEESLEHTERVHNVHIHQTSKSNVLIESLTIQNGKTRNNFYCDLAGEEAVLDIDGLCILDGEQKADNWSEIRHSVPHCTSDELFKYTVNDRAVGSFSGKIYVAKDAQKTIAYQNNRNLVLSKNGKMFSKPQLEIYADDVRCSHGMTTGAISEEALFYLQQRGIPYMEAKLMLTIAFMSDVLERIRLDSLRERLLEVVANRFRGIPSYCQK